MTVRKILVSGTAAVVLAVAMGCDSKDGGNAPKAETTPGTPKLEMKKPGGAPGAPGPAPQ